MAKERKRDYSKHRHDPTISTPFPELIVGEPFKIQPATDGVARVSRRDHVMMVPLAPLTHAEAVQAHELGHLAISPPEGPEVVAKMYNVDVELVMGIEDALVNAYLVAKGVEEFRQTPTLAPGAVGTILTALVKHGDLTRAAAFLLAGLFSGDAKEADLWLKEQAARQAGGDATAAEQAILTVLKELHGYQAHIRCEIGEGNIDKVRTTILEAARDQLKAYYTAQKQRKQVAERCGPLGDGTLGDKMRETMARSITSIADSHQITDPLRKLRARRLASGDDGNLEHLRYTERTDKLTIDEHFHFSIPGSHWAPMLIEKAPLTVRYKPQQKDRHARYRTTDEGVFLRRPSRYLVDYAIFATRKREFGASVLIDASGSMGFSAADIEHMLRILPTTVVAMYSAQAREGKLTILAEKGRSAAVIDRFGSGNGCDGLALRWLAKQPEPRIWISDGGVTGQGDVPSRELALECIELQLRHRIVRVGTVEEARQLLRLRAEGI